MNSSFNGGISDGDYKAAVALDKATGGNLAAQMREDMEKVKLKPYRQELLNAFYAARREASSGERIPYATLTRIADTVNYEADHAISIMQQLDDELIRLNNEKQQRELEKMKAKGAKR